MDTLRRLCVAVWLLALLMTTQTTAVSIAQTAPGDWPTYMGSIDRTGFNASETAITNTTASDMQLKWSVKRPSSIETQPIEANNLVYTEGMDGNEVALDTAGNQVWQSFVGTMSASCYRVLHGATSTAAVAEETVGGTPTSILYVGGFGNGQTELYALDAQTGTVLWQTALGDSVNSDNYIWSSPLVYNGSVYVGVASDGDCPLVQGTLVQMDAVTGVIQHVFKAVPDGCVGAGIWGSPTVDAATGIIYVATGNPIAPVNCATKTAFYGQSLVALNASDLSVAAAWQIPSSQGIDDGDFGSTPTLFTAMLNGQPRNLVGIVNKNGIYYAFDRSNIATGPVWESTVSVAGGAPDSGLGAITPSAWDGHYLYIAGGNETLNGVSCPSVLQALDPPSGAPVWQTCLSTGPVLGAVTVVPGVVEVGAGREIILADAASGNVLYTYVNAAVTDDKFQAAGSISNGVLYQGDTQGYIYAWAPVTTSIHTTASLSGTSFCGLYTEPVTVTLSATDTGGTIAGTSYQIGQGPVTTYTGPFQVSGSGNHTVTFHSTDTNGSVEPTRTLAFATGPLIGLSTVKGGYGTNVPVSGSTFQPGETVKVHWDSSATTPLATATATSACAVSTSFLVPQATLGNHHVIAVGQSSHRSATASFQVKPAVALNPSAARQGTRISVSSYNFQPGEIVNVYWNSIGGTSLGSGTAGSNGTVPAISITVPQAPYGFYKVFAVGATSGAYGSQPFKVMPMLTVSPPSGAAGSPATVSGSGFGANETVTILWDCSTYACTGSTALGTVVTDAAGNFGGSSKIPPVTIVIPKNATHVTHTLAGKGTVNSFDFRTATYRVTS